MEFSIGSFTIKGDYSISSYPLENVNADIRRWPRDYCMNPLRHCQDQGHAPERQ